MIEPWPKDKPKHWRTTRAVRSTSVVVPSHFRTDGASIPRPVWSLIGAPWNVRYGRAAIVHDYLYRQGGRLKEQSLTRKQADSLFFDTLIEDGVPKWRAWVMWSAVRAGGWPGWDRD